MSNYRRNREGATFSFTVVTHGRRKFLTSRDARGVLREAFATVRAEHGFEVIAIVLLPDHLHAIWELPPGDTDYSNRWRLIKGRFTQAWLARGSEAGNVSKSKRAKGERGVWQRRFFEHTCRDARDLKRCVDYIHVNPLKHGLVERVSDWPWSSFHRYVRQGEYPNDWGNASEWYGDEFYAFE